MSLEDEILRLAYSQHKIERITAKFERLSVGKVETLLYRAQRKIEQKHMTDRLAILRYDKDRVKAIAPSGQDPILLGN